MTKTGDIKQKRYNLEWIPNGIPPATEEELEAFFAKIKEDKERADRATSRSTGQSEKELVMGKVRSSVPFIAFFQCKRISVGVHEQHITNFFSPCIDYD